VGSSPPSANQARPPGYRRGPFSDKMPTGELAGYDMVIIGHSHAGSALGLFPNGFTCRGHGSPIDETAAAACIGHGAMHNLFDDTPAYTGADTADMAAKGTTGHVISAVGGVFDGWGYVHLLNANTLHEIDAYAIPEGVDPAFQTGLGSLSVHEVQTDPRAKVNLAYFSYYDAGFRVAKFGKNGIEEVGHHRGGRQLLLGDRAPPRRSTHGGQGAASSPERIVIADSGSSGTRASRSPCSSRPGEPLGDLGPVPFASEPCRSVRRVTEPPEAA